MMYAYALLIRVYRYINTYVYRSYVHENVRNVFTKIRLDKCLVWMKFTTGAKLCGQEDIGGPKRLDLSFTGLNILDNVSQEENSSD